MTLEAHPLAELFPMMEGPQFAGLVSDIRENGLREPIITFEGKILDGRNRYAACTEVGVEPMTRPWDGKGDPLSYVISKNLNRRHLDEAQRAMVAAKIANMRQGFRTDLLPMSTKFISATTAAELLNVGLRTVHTAKGVNEKGVPELRAAVEAGHVSLRAASAIASQPEEKQKEIVMRGAKAMAEEASIIRQTRTPSNGRDARRINADIWIQFRDALGGIKGMPLASDVAKVVHAHDKAKTTGPMLERAIRWLSDFEKAWNEINSDKAA
jgi:hypothetical protein